jgi:hypothetical protein
LCRDNERVPVLDTATDKVILTHCRALSEKYSPAGLGKIRAALRAMVRPGRQPWADHDRGGCVVAYGG